MFCNNIDDAILANIKTQQDSDDENVGDGEALMVGGFPGDANVAERNDDDPLLTTNERSTKEFRWHCTGNDFLKPYSYEEEQEDCDLKVSSCKSKKARMETDLKGLHCLWSKVPLTPPIADDLPGCVSVGRGPAKNVSSVVEAWHLLFDVPMLNQVVKSTNEVIKSTKKKESHQKRLTDITELRAWLGLNYLCGVLRNSPHSGPTEELWTLELGNAIFRATMTYKRFEYLTQCLRTADRNVECVQSPLDEIANIWEKLVINLRSYYSPSDFCMIDEHILDLTTDPRNPFEHTVPSQPGCKGLRFLTMCDAKTLYISNALVANNQPMDEEVYQVVSDIKGTRRCLCLSERSCSMALMQKLKQCQLQVVGALSNGASEIPPELHNGSQVPQVWYTKNDTTLISGLHESVTPTRFLVTNGLSTRINAVKLFQTIKVSNFKALEQMSTYSTRHSTTNHQNWALNFFYYMLDLSVFNSWILFRLSENGDAQIGQRDFQRQLGLYLTQQQLKQRMHMNIKISLPLKLQIAEILGESVESILNSACIKISDGAKQGSIPFEKALVPEGIIIQSRENENRRRCRGCKSANGSKIKSRCQQCLTPFCMRHLIARCESCSGYELQQSDLETNKNDEHIVADVYTSLE